MSSSLQVELGVLGLPEDLRNLRKILNKYLWLILEKVFSLENETSLII